MVNAKDEIIDAFLILIDEKDFGLLTVKDIVEKSGYSRSTFYLHFTDKYDLLDVVRAMLNEKFLSFYHDENTSSQHVTRHLCRHILLYRAFYRMEFSDPEAVVGLSNVLTETLFTTFDDWDYAIFASYGTVGYLHKWLKEGFIISPNEAADKLMKIGHTDWTMMHGES